MWLLLIPLALISPRLVLLLLWLFSDALSRTFDGWVLPVLGFLLLPWTTLSYVAFFEWGAGQQVTGIEWVGVALAFVFDLASMGGAARD